jgi:hypothetical protein
MSRRPAAVTQADVNRIVRVARQTGCASVTVKINGAEIVIDLRDPPSGDVIRGREVARRKPIAL